MTPVKKAAKPAPKAAAKKSAKTEKADVVHNEDGPVYVTFANKKSTTYPNPREARAALRDGGLSVRDGFTKHPGNKWVQNPGGAAMIEKAARTPREKSADTKSKKTAKAKASEIKAKLAKWKLVATGTHEGVDYTVAQNGSVFKAAYVMAGQTFAAGEHPSKADAVKAVKETIELNLG